MKIKHIVSLVVMTLFFTLFSCSNNEDFTIATGKVIKTVETGDATVTAVSAIVKGKVTDLSQMNAASYNVGVVYGTREDPTTTGQRVVGTIDSLGVVTTRLQGLSKGITYYYATYVTLEGQLTTFGDVKSFVSTDAKITTDDATNITPTKATLTASMHGLDGIMVEGQTEIRCGFKLSTSKDDVKQGVDYAISSVKNKFSYDLSGLIPGHT